MDLFSCQNSTYRLFASSFVGFIEDPKKQLLLPMYQRERNLFDSLPIDSPERYNSHAIVENLIVSTQIRIVLGVENNKSSNRLGQEWINLLYEIIEDSMNGYQWNSHSWALAILNFTQSSTQRFKDHFVKYEEYYKKNAGKNAIISESLLKDIKGGVTETEMFKSINDNLVMEKVDAAKEIQLEPDVQELIYDLISFMRQNYSA
ncbi:hypothetical protein [Flavisolibacter tropicus]|uniref:Uncharacterized protein n=1 Tax=Flavisolibacter tropicus TaxID=1492898 RepID=A0A172TUU7_9BACT|nr:hypothetical protein [Flavisolibacter tropicus]ANE50772.1 hypothetical protein SY85_09930 [Flavisolibacter tropicus]